MEETDPEAPEIFPEKMKKAPRKDPHYSLVQFLDNLLYIIGDEVTVFILGTFQGILLGVVLSLIILRPDF